MDRWSIAFAVLLEDPVSVLSTLVRGSELPVTPIPENLMPSLASEGTCTHVHISCPYTYIDKIKNKLIFNKSVKKKSTQTPIIPGTSKVEAGL